MPSILVRIGRSVSKHDNAPVLTIVNMGLFDHTLDGILDIISFDLFNLSWLGHVSATVKNESTAYSSLSDILDLGV